jgi:hypothetical protein
VVAENVAYHYGATTLPLPQVKAASTTTAAIFAMVLDRKHVAFTTLLPSKEGYN